MIEEPAQKRPGDNGFYVITNADIYLKVTKLDSDMRQLKHSFRLIGYVIMPAVTTIITLFVNSLFT